MKPSTASGLRRVTAATVATVTANVPRINPRIDFSESAPSNIISFPTSNGRHFDNKYHEEVRLKNGVTVNLRLIQPSDHDLYIEGFHHLSSQSKYFRFNQMKKKLSEEEIQYFTNADQENHFALVATIFNQQLKHEQLVGVAEIFRLPDDGPLAPSTIAEPAIMVMDNAQGNGLGHLLLLRLIDAARERKIDHFESIILMSNTRMLHLMSKIFKPNFKIESLGCGQVLVSCTLPSAKLHQ